MPVGLEAGGVQNRTEIQWYLMKKDPAEMGCGVNGCERRVRARFERIVIYGDPVALARRESDPVA